MLRKTTLVYFLVQPNTTTILFHILSEGRSTSSIISNAFLGELHILYIKISVKR